METYIYIACCSASPTLMLNTTYVVGDQYADITDINLYVKHVITNNLFGEKYIPTKCLIKSNVNGILYFIIKEIISGIELQYIHHMIDKYKSLI